MAYLILVRHGESEWNAKGIWTGLTDIPLSEKGREEARLVAKALKDIKIDIAYTSRLIRAKQTLDEIERCLPSLIPQTIENKALNERNYGILTGKNKWEIQKEVGENKFQMIRRGWNTPIQNGETLKDVYNRVVPYYKKEVLLKLKEGKNVLIVSHGNSLRALVKYLENISDKDVENLEIATGEVDVYNFNMNGKIISKEVRLSNNNSSMTEWLQRHLLLLTKILVSLTIGYTLSLLVEKSYRTFLVLPSYVVVLLSVVTLPLHFIPVFIRLPSNFSHFFPVVDFVLRWFWFSLMIFLTIKIISYTGNTPLGKVWRLLATVVRKLLGITKK